MKQIDSETIISRAAVPSETGTPHGEHGLVTQDDLRVVEWLASRSPYQVEKALVSRASSRNVDLDIIYEHRFPRDDKGRPLPVQSVFRGVTVRGDREQIKKVCDDFRKALAPATQEMIEGWLAELSVITAKRNDDDFAEMLRIGAYVARLQRYPADILYEILLRRSHKFFPTWADLEPDLERMTRARHAVIHSLETKAKPPEPYEPRCSAESARSIMREVFGEE